MSITQLSRLIRLLIFSFLIVQCLSFVFTWTHPAIKLGSFSLSLSTKGLSYKELAELDWSLRAIGALLGALPLGFMLAGMWQLHRMLKSLNAASLFSIVNIGHLQHFSAAIFISTLLAIIEPPLRAFIYTRLGAKTLQKMSFSISSEELLLCLFCFLFYLLIQLLHAARRLEEENKEFI